MKKIMGMEQKEEVLWWNVGNIYIYLLFIFSSVGFLVKYFWRFNIVMFSFVLFNITYK